MSSTEKDGAGGAAAARALFIERVLPVADRAKAAGKTLMAGGPDPTLATYYATRAKRTMSPEDFEVPALESPAALEKGLAAYWTSIGLGELCELAAPLAKLAGELKSGEDEDGEVSPMIYVMF